MKLKRVGALVAAIALATGLSACGSAGGTSGGDGSQPYIAIVSKGFQQEYWQAVKKGAQQEAAKEGARMTFVGPATEADVEDQINMLTNALQKNPDALGFAALDSKAAAPLMQQAKSSNIPVIAFDSGVDSDVPVTTVATDNKAAAAEAAKHMAELLHGHGLVGMVVHDQTSRSGIDRRDGFIQWMKQNAPGITLLPVQYGGGDQAKSADITKSIITAHPDIAGIYGSNEGSAIGVVQGVKESGKKGIVVVGFDSGQAQIDAINNGIEAGAITQAPYLMGRALIQAAMKALDGKSVPKTIDTPYYWYDQSNINDPKIAKELYH